MRAFHRGDTVRLVLPVDFEAEVRHDPAKYTIIVPRAEFEELRAQILDGDVVRAELKRALDDALQQIERLSDDRDHWEQEAENWKRVADSPFRQGLDCSPANVEALNSYAARVERERDALKGERDALRQLQRLEPARMVIHWTDAEKSDWESGDVATADVLAKIAATAPVGSLVDDLKNTIVSQAREIARLKGESE